MSTQKKCKLSGMGDIPRELIGEICIYEEDPSVLFSLMLVNKHFRSTIISSGFNGSSSMIFYIGLRNNPLEDDEGSDDELFKRLFPKKADTDNHPLEKKRRFGLTDDNIDFLRRKMLLVTPVTYVRRIRVVEVGCFYDSNTLNEVIQRFPRVIDLEMNNMIYVEDDFFMRGQKNLRPKKLDICGCNNLSSTIFGQIGGELEELHVSKQLCDLKNNITFGKLKKLVIKTPFTGMDQPDIDTTIFHEHLSLPKILEIEFLNVSFKESPQEEEEEDTPYFLQHYPTLRRLKILRSENVTKKMIQNLPHLHSLDINAFDNSFFQDLTNLRELKLRGGTYSSKTTFKIFDWMTSLRVLDLTKFEGFSMYSYDVKTETFSDQCLRFLRKLKVLRMCCKKSNFVPILRAYDTFENYRCGCVEAIGKLNLGPRMEVDEEFKELLKKGRLAHFSCLDCSGGCQRCDKKAKDCSKLGLEECFECKRMVCCASHCEKCNRWYCSSCARIRRQMPFCGDMCGYEMLCTYCFNGIKACMECRAPICIKCSKICVGCDRLCCTEDCIITYNEDEEELPPEECLCNGCN